MGTSSDNQQLVEESAILHAILRDECSDLVASALSTSRVGPPFREDLVALCKRHRGEVEEILLKFLSAQIDDFSIEDLRLMISHIRFFRLVCPELADQILSSAAMQRH